MPDCISAQQHAEAGNLSYEQTPTMANAKQQDSKRKAGVPEWAVQFGLNARQSAFVDQYLIDFNATQAAIRAGYSAKTAGSQASTLLQNPNIQKGIQHRTQARNKRVALDQDYVLNRLRDELEADLSELFGDRGELLPVHEWPMVWRKGLVADVDTKEEFDDGVFTGLARKVKTGDRLKRLELLMRHLGMLNDKVQVDAGEQLLAAARAVTHGAQAIKPGGLDIPDED